MNLEGTHTLQKTRVCAYKAGRVEAILVPGVAMTQRQLAQSQCAIRGNVRRRWAGWQKVLRALSPQLACKATSAK